MIEVKDYLGKMQYLRTNYAFMHTGKQYTGIIIWELVHFEFVINFLALTIVDHGFFKFTIRMFKSKKHKLYKIK